MNSEIQVFLFSIYLKCRNNNRCNWVYEIFNKCVGIYNQNKLWERIKDCHLPTTNFSKRKSAFQWKITRTWNKMPQVVLKCSHSVFGMRNDYLTKNITYKHIAFWDSYLSNKLYLWVTKWFTMQPLLFKVCIIRSLNKNSILLPSKTTAANRFSTLSHKGLLPLRTRELTTKLYFSVPLP